MSCNTTSQNYKPQYKEEEIYISRTIIKYDEYGNVISRDTYYDKEINYADRTNNLHTIQPMLNTHYNQPYNQPHNQPHNQSQDVSSTHTSPSSSVPTSPTSPTSLDSVSINMNNISMYNY